MSRPRLVLASGSAIRAQMLSAAGLEFEVMRPDVDEAAVKRAMTGASAEEIALTLAETKARAVSSADALVIGADQILEFEGRHFDKPKTRKEAGERLLAMSGKTHFLVNGAVVIENGETAFANTERVALAMRKHDAGEIFRYLEKAGPEALASVGAYQVENLGAGLFERIDGDYFTVPGLALLPLMGFLKSRGVSAW